jgi:hypothetical protein
MAKAKEAHDTKQSTQPQQQPQGERHNRSAIVMAIVARLAVLSGVLPRF